MILFIFLTTIFSVVLLFISFLSLVFSHYTWFDWTNWAGWGGLTIATFVVIGIAIIKAMGALSTLVLNYFQKRKKLPASKTGAWINPGRRHFLAWSLNLGLIAVSSSITVRGLSEALVPRIKEVDIEIENLPPDLEAFRIVQITDLHISTGVQIHRGWVQKVVDRVNHLAPDIIAFTGDIADGLLEQIKDNAMPLTGLHSTYGNFFVTGNHEYWYGIDGIIHGMKELGFSVLTNEHCLLKKGRASLLIGGVADYSAQDLYGHDSSPAKALGTAGGADVKILLAHQPQSVYEAAQVGFDLQLSGHTHGGQCALGAWLRSFGQPFQSGLYRYKNTQLYVSNGTGYWGPPLRFGAPAEITLLKLTRKRHG